MEKLDIRPVIAAIKNTVEKHELKEKGSYCRWLWGGTVYAQIAFTVSKAPGRELKVNILSLYLTDWAMNFPKILEKLNAAAAQEVKKLKIGEMIESISFENGQFVITYDPQLMAQMLFRRKR